MTVYTLGIWNVRPGREDDFVTAWTEMARRTRADFPEAVGTLLRDLEHPGLFISYGPWETPEQVEQWRASEVFTTSVADIRTLLMSFEPHTMLLTQQVG